jgi:hypothetical protein
MAGFTLAQAQAQLDAWLAASLAVASSQSYEITVEGNTASSAGPMPARSGGRSISGASR